VKNVVKELISTCVYSATGPGKSKFVTTSFSENISKVQYENNVKRYLQLPSIKKCKHLFLKRQPYKVSHNIIYRRLPSIILTENSGTLISVR